jgi:predicted RNA-binding protein with PUA-like domain
MAIWLLKTEPSVYSFADLERDGETMWDGVTNNLALKNIRLIEKGDVALIYHTGDEKQIAGIAQVTRGFYVNPEFEDDKLAVCDVRADKKLEKPISLTQIKATPQLSDWDLVKNSRLSVVPVSEAQWEIVQTLR